MSKHAFLSASGSHRWLKCEAAPWREKDLPDTAGEAAKRGTALHSLRALYIGGAEELPAEIDGYKTIALLPDIEEGAAALKYELESADEVYIEKALRIEGVTTEHEAFGTPDLVFIKGNTLTIEDLKTGRVRVEAAENPQLIIYAASALDAYDPAGLVDLVELRISQGGIGGSITYPVAEIRAMADSIRGKAKRILTLNPEDLVASPDENSCRYCKAAPSCRELQNEVESLLSVSCDAEVSRLDDVMLKIPMLEGWIKSIQSEVFRRLEHGDEFPNFVLGTGREGNRKWSNEADVEKLRKKARILKTQIYELALMSPVQVQKVLKGSPEVWERFDALVVRSAGKPCITKREKGSTTGKTIQSMFEEE